MMDRLPLNTVDEIFRHPSFVAQEVVGFLSVHKRLAQFARVPLDTLVLWKKQLKAAGGLQASLLEARERLRRDRSDRYSIGGDVGPYNEILYLLVRAAQPQLVVETGVAHGFSTAHILQALEDNNHGFLYSIDLANLNPRGYVNAGGAVDAVFVDSEEAIGSVIPQDLKTRWQLIRDKSNPALGRLLDELGSVDVFYHDSDHSYQNMKWEFEIAWPHITPGGLLVSDDVTSSRAFSEFCDNVKLEPFRWLGRSGRDAAVRKPPTSHSA